MSRHTQRLARLERATLANMPRRLFMINDGDPEPENLGPRDVVIVICYADPPPATDQLLEDAGAVVFLPDNGRGDSPKRGRLL